MNKAEFLAALRSALGKLPEQEIRASLDFYAEAIDDRVEDGASEEEAVAALGDANAIAAQIIAETPPIPKAVAKMKTGSRTANIVLAIVLSPLWVPLALAFVLCVAAIYLSIWIVIAALWACVAVLLLCGPIGIAGLAYCLATGYPLTGLWLLGCGIAGSGLGLFALLGMKAVSRGLVQLTGMFANGVKSLFVKRGGTEALKEGAASAASDVRSAAETAAGGMRSAAAAAASGVKETASAAAAGLRETAAVAAAGAKGAVAGAKAAMHEASASHAADTAKAQRPDAAASAATAQASNARCTSAAQALDPAAAPGGDAPVPPPGYVASSAQAAADVAAQVVARSAARSATASPVDAPSQTEPQPDAHPDASAPDQTPASFEEQPAPQQTEAAPQPEGGSHDDRA